MHSRAFRVLGYLQMGHYTGKHPGAATASIRRQQRQAEQAAQRKAALAEHIAKTKKENRVVQEALAADGLTAEERERFVQQAQRSERARTAQRDGKRKPKPKRASAPLPSKSKMFIPAMAADGARDTGLTIGAKACLVFIFALSQKREMITKAGLAALLSRSIRQVQRYLEELEDRDYITRDMAHSAAGWVIGQIIKITAKVLPFFQRPRPRNGGFPMVTEMSYINCLSAVNPPYPHVPLVAGG